MSFWGGVVTSDKPYELTVPAPLNVTQAVLPVESKGVVTVWIEEILPEGLEIPEGQEAPVPICVAVLQWGRNEQSRIDIILEEEGQYKFTVKGNSPVHLAGFFQINDDMESFDDSDIDSAELDSDLIDQDSKEGAPKVEELDEAPAPKAIAAPKVIAPKVIAPKQPQQQNKKRPADGAPEGQQPAKKQKTAEAPKEKQQQPHQLPKGPKPQGGNQSPKQGGQQQQQKPPKQGNNQSPKQGGQQQQQKSPKQGSNQSPKQGGQNNKNQHQNKKHGK